MNAKQARTLEAIFADPVRSGPYWRDILALFKAPGAEVRQGDGSRIRVRLNGVRAMFHEPHPEKTTGKGAVKSVRLFLESVGITP
ncbi:type II toxin-antitoxin system HicA family toxin [Solidesulfovibrio sp.]|uniref:type II toxin-antitoxin system HicA family toxin n=1 Tax=Solidesulfovibrio sp. TaxID=2910990 RepID=UPI002621002B|nr:type II toxin-antitoxin system HicA family toxin [Solidesulfovibrio sp.]